MFSRLYLGVHSPADIVAGGIIGCVILAYWIKIDTIVDRSISFGDNGMYCCSTDSLIVHFREWMVPQFHLQFQYSVSQAYRLWKTFLYLCQFAHLSWASLGFHGLKQQGVLLLSPSPPWWNAGYPLPGFSGSYCTDREPHHSEGKVSWTSRHHRGPTRFLNLDLSI